MSDFADKFESSQLEYRDSLENYFSQHDKFKAKSSSEFERLKDICGEQKDLIGELRKRIENSTEDENTEPVEDEGIKALERLLKDYEMCIQTLESEIDNLHESIGDLKGQLEDRHNNVNNIVSGFRNAITNEGADTAPVNMTNQPEVVSPNNDNEATQIADNNADEKLQEQNRLLKEKNGSLQNVLSRYEAMEEYLIRLKNVGTIDDISNLLLQTLSNQQGKALLMIRSNGNEISGTNFGSEDSKDMNVLRSMEVRQAQMEIDTDVIINIPPVKLMLKDVGNNNGLVDESFVQWVQDVTGIGAIAAELIIQNTARNTTQLEQMELLEKLKRSVATVLVTSEYVRNETQVINKDVWENIDLVTSMIDLTEKQSGRFSEISNESQARLELLFASSKTMKQSFESIVSALEKSCIPKKS